MKKNMILEVMDIREEKRDFDKFEELFVLMDVFRDI